MLIWGGLTNNWEKKRSERQRRKGRYAQLNTEFQGIAGRDKKVLNEQWEEIEENSRMWKIRDFFKIIKNNANMGPIRDKNSMDQSEAEEIKKR